MTTCWSWRCRKATGVAAELYLRRLRVDDPWRPMRKALVTIQFGPAQERSAALSRLRTVERPALAQVVISAMHGGRDPALADAVAGFLLGADRTPDDRRRGAQYRLVAVAAQGRSIDAVSAWKAVAGDEPFDAWIVQAALAGFPTADLAKPMYDWARRQVEARRSPDFRRPYWDEVRESFDALVDRATLAGDSAEVTGLLRQIEEAPRGSPADPGPETLRASLRARLALLAADTTRAIDLLQTAVSRIAEPWTANFPLTAMGPQRYLLAELLGRQGNAAQANVGGTHSPTPGQSPTSFTWREWVGWSVGLLAEPLRTSAANRQVVPSHQLRGCHDHSSSRTSRSPRITTRREPPPSSSP